MKVGMALETACASIDKIDAELLLTCVLSVGRATLRAFPERELTVDQKAKFKDFLQRRINGEPIAYLLGHKEFWSLDFLVSPDVLIPRADTELIVEMVLEQIEPKRSMRILELGTGCGAIALSIAHERPRVTVLATDISAEALQISKLNAKHLHICNVEFALGNWFDALHGVANNKFDIIVSNPPYVAQFDPHLTQGDLRFEPNRALVAGVEGMDDLQIIIQQAKNYLNTDGQLFLEHGYDQEQSVAKALMLADFKEVQCFRDLAGVPRVSAGIC